MRRVLLGALASLAFAAPAVASEPLNQYVVEGSPAELAALGHDLTEGGIVATPAQARALRERGLEVTPLGEENTAPGKALAAGIPLPDPTWGYDVFRPYALNPAPCQQTCSGAVGAAGQPVSLRTYYDTLAAANPTLVKRVVYGQSLNGLDLVAYRVTAGANTSADGSKPGLMVHAAQHAREWISPEVVRREFQYFMEHSADAASGIPAILASSEVWFIPVFNPDGYDYTFQTRASRLWRKNLRDTNGNGTIGSSDGVDTNRNFAEHWGYDNEGSSATLSNETYRGAAPESEPEVAGFHALMKRIKPRFYIDYHSYASLVLYPLGWQVETHGSDSPLMEALAGNDRNPSVAGYDPDVGGELYTTNGEVTDTMYSQEGVLSYTVELDGGSGAAVGGTTTAGNAVGSNPGGFVFQDREADVEAVFAKNLPFMLDLARSAPAPDQPSSHIGAQIPDFAPSAFGISYGSPQTVEVNVRRALGDVTVNWQVVGSSAVSQASTSEFAGGSRYGKPGVYFHRVRGDVTGFAPGDQVKVWFTAGGRTSDPFTFTASPNGRGNRALILSAEDYSEASGSGPAFLSYYLTALQDAGIPADVYDVDANGRNQADLLGVLEHYQAVIWYTGVDDYVRDPGQTAGVSKMYDDQMNAVRDYLNEGGKVLVTGQRALQGTWSEYSYNPLGRFPAFPQCRSNTSSVGPVGQLENCVNVSNDFMQYWLGAYSRGSVATSRTAVSARALSGVTPFSTTTFQLNGGDSADSQSYLPSFGITSDTLPQFASQPTHRAGTSAAVGVATASTLLWGFGIENVNGRATRAALLAEGLGYLGVTRDPPAAVSPTLSLTLGPAANFGAFSPGVAREYTATTTVKAVGGALTVAGPGHLTNGDWTLREPLQVEITPGAIQFRQRIGASEPLRAGTYSRALTFTLSSTTP